MLDRKRFMVCRVLALCLSLALVTLIAFRLFRNTPPESAQVIEHKELIFEDEQALQKLVDEKERATEEELKKLNVEIEELRNNLSPQEQAEFDAQVELLIAPTGPSQQEPESVIEAELTQEKTAKPEKTSVEKKAIKKTPPKVTSPKPVVLEKKQAAAPQVVPQETVTKKMTEQVVVKPAETKKIALPTVSVKNNIKKQMTGYKKMGKTWYPDEYHVLCNGIELEEGKSITLRPEDGNVCKFSFDYDFRPMGTSYKKGTEELEYTIPEGTESIDIAFSWYEKPTLVIKAHKNQKEESHKKTD